MLVSSFLNILSNLEKLLKNIKQGFRQNYKTQVVEQGVTLRGRLPLQATPESQTLDNGAASQ